MSDHRNRVQSEGASVFTQHHEACKAYLQYGGDLGIGSQSGCSTSTDVGAVSTTFLGALVR